MSVVIVIAIRLANKKFALDKEGKKVDIKIRGRSRLLSKKEGELSARRADRQHCSDAVVLPYPYYPLTSVLPILPNFIASLKEPSIVYSLAKYALV